MRAVDTNVLMRLIMRDDPKQVVIAEEFLGRTAWASHVVVAEVAWSLESNYGMDARGIASAIELLLDHPSLAVQKSDVVRAAVDGFRRKPAVEFSDHLILEVARKAGHLPLGTFDRGLGKLDGAQAL
jgi:predicted nucleic-acid-binding protein